MRALHMGKVRGMQKVDQGSSTGHKVIKLITYINFPRSLLVYNGWVHCKPEEVEPACIECGNGAVAMQVSQVSLSVLI